MMNLINIKRCSVIVIFMTITATLSAQSRVMAIQTPITYTQPNGTKIEYRLFGDERTSYRTTLDGYLIRLDDREFYCYVTVDKRFSVRTTNRRVGIDKANRCSFKVTEPYLNHLYKHAKTP